jgi:hypothetical protein
MCFDGYCNKVVCKDNECKALCNNNDACNPKNCNTKTGECHRGCGCLEGDCNPDKSGSCLCMGDYDGAQCNMPILHKGYTVWGSSGPWGTIEQCYESANKQNKIDDQIKYFQFEPSSGSNGYCWDNITDDVVASLRHNSTCNIFDISKVKPAPKKPPAKHM